MNGGTVKIITAKINKFLITFEPEARDLICSRLYRMVVFYPDLHI